MSEPLYKFRLHIKKTDYGKGGYVIVNLWNTRHEMLEAAGYTYYAAHANTSFDVTPSGNQSKIITINFWYKKLKLKYISHEISHAVLAWCRWYDVDLSTNKGEELFCEIQGDLNKQFHLNLKQRNIYDLVIFS